MEYTVEIEVPSEADAERAGETVAIAVDESEYILAAARREGVWLPADCQQGWCTAKPRSDLRIRSHQHEAMLDHRAEHDLPPGKSKR